MTESQEELKSHLMKVKEESEKKWLRTQHSQISDHGIRSHHFMANRWGNSGNSDRLYFGASESLQMVTVAMKLFEIKVMMNLYSIFKSISLLLGRKAMTKLDSLLKSIDIILPTKICLVKAMVSPVVLYGCESWTIKKDKH